MAKQEKCLVLNVSGVGYLVYITRGLLEKTHIGQELTFYIHTNVREDDISLYGFLSQEEWQFFKLLLTVSGVGPKSALEIMNAPMNKVKNAIATKEVSFLTQIQGIGRKTAERIIVDLQGKVENQVLEDGAKCSAPARGEEIVQALVSLGYHRQQVLQGLKKVPSKIEDEEAIIKYFLQNI